MPEAPKNIVFQEIYIYSTSYKINQKIMYPSVVYPSNVN